MIVLEHLEKAYADVTPLKDINVTIEKGEVISIIGPSGTGKSTLLRCLNMLEKPTKGRILLEGEDITAPNCKLNKVRQRMGMVFQAFNLFSHMNVLENITYAPRKLLGLTQQEADEQAKELLQAVGLVSKIYAYPDELSGGQKQRVAIVRALAMHPEIILLDEPTSALDPTSVGEIINIIKKLAAQGLTLLIVTHEMKFAREVSTRVFYMDQGIIYEEGTPEQIFEHPTKERTKQFIQKLQVFRWDTVVADIDYAQLNSALEEFIRKHKFPYRLANGTQLIVEEMLVTTLAKLLPETSSLLLMVEYDVKKEIVEITFLYQGSELNPFSQMEELSQKLITGFAQEFSHKYGQEANQVRIVLTNE